MKKIFFSFILIIILILLHARYISTSNLITKEYTLTDSIPTSYDGLKIVHFSDIHYGNNIDETMLTKIADEINLINPDIIVFTGDLVDEENTITKEDETIITNFLSSLKATYAKYAVRGNNDYINCSNYETLLTEGGFIYLNNTYDIIYNSKNDKILIGGLDTTTYNMEDASFLLDDAISNITYKIILTHEPDTVDEILAVDDSINLVLAGHSHNGQINIPFIKTFLLPKYATKYYENYYQINSTKLYISSGIGNHLINMRIFNYPSINFYRLNSKNT